jgi:hypothetical protein
MAKCPERACCCIQGRRYSGWRRTSWLHPGGRFVEVRKFVPNAWTRTRPQKDEPPMKVGKTCASKLLHKVLHNSFPKQPKMHRNRSIPPYISQQHTQG